MTTKHKNIVMTAAVGIAAVIMAVITLLSALNLANRSDLSLSAEGKVPTVIETTEELQYIGTREGDVLCRTAAGERVWERDVTLSGSVQGIVAAGEEILCVTSESKEFAVLDADGNRKGEGITSSYFPVQLIANEDYAVIYTHLNTKNQLLAFSREDGDTDLTGMQKSGIDLPEFTNIEFLSDGRVLCLGTDSVVYLWDPAQAAAGLEELFSADTEELIYMTHGETGFEAVTKDGKFVTYSETGAVLSRNAKGGIFEKVASGYGYIAAVTNQNELSLFDGSKVYSVKAGVKVSKLMLSRTGVFLIDKSDNISAYDFDRIAVNAIWKFLLPVFASLFAVSALAFATVCLLTSRRTGAGFLSLLSRIWTALKTYRKTYLFLLLPFGLLAVFGYFPVIWGFVLAFTRYVPGVTMEFKGLENFAAVFQNTNFLLGSKNMLIFLVTDLIKALIPCFILAEVMFLMRMKRFGYFSRVLTVLPGVLPGIAMLFIWTTGIFGANGLLNMFLQSLGFDQFNFNWLGNERTALNTLIVYGFPYLGSYIMLFGALRSIPESLHEAATMDGCGIFRRTFTIDVPLLTPQFKYILVTTFIASIQDFGRSFMTTGGEYGTMIPALEVYYQINKYHDYGVAAAMSIVLFVLIFVVTIFNQRTKTESIY